MNIGAWNALLVIALLIVLSGGGYILYHNHEQKQAEIAQAQEEARIGAEKKAVETAALRLDFENFLNDFLQSIYEDMRAYKKERGVLKELMQPVNLRDTDYIAENAKLAEGAVLRLQLRMDDIMGQFTKADEALKALVVRFEDEEGAIVQESWSTVRDENAEKFLAFFESDRALLLAYLKLIEFYDAHKDVLSVDVDNARVVFEDLGLQEEEALLRAEILRLQAEQRDIFKRN